MAAVAFRTAIRDALDEELAADERVILFGEDIAVAGGVFATTTGLYDKYGAERVFDTPISELALTGAAFGSAVHGLRPVLEIMFGVRAFTAIVDPPQAAILAVGGVRRAPVEDADGGVVFRDLMTATLTCDHRVVYGADGAQFLSRLRDLLERPLELTL